MVTRLDYLKWRSLDPHERQAIKVALALLPMVSVALKLAGFKRVHAWMLSSQSARNPSGHEDTHHVNTARQLARMVDIAARKGIYPGNCLSQSLVLARILERNGIPFDLRIGVRKNGTRLEAHAWLECQGRPVNDSEDVAQRFLPFGGDVTDFRGFSK